MTSGQSQMKENVAGGLCYLVGWITGLIFFLIDKRPFVRFHAAQSIVVFGGLNILTYALRVMFGFGTFGWGPGFVFSGFGSILTIIGIVEFVLWLVLMIKAFQGQRFRVPLAGDVVEQLFGKM